MNPTKKMIEHLNILNILLFAGAVLLFFLLDYPLLTGPNTIAKREPKSAPVQGEEKAAPAGSMAYLDYAAVAEKNLFHPERKVPVEKKDKQLVVRPEIVLYGTLITGDKKIAYLEDKKAPFATPGRGKRQVAVVEGGMVSGYKLGEVHEDFIVLTRADDKMIVRLNDQKIRTRGQSQAAGQTAPSAGPKMPFPERQSGPASAGQVPPAAPPQPAAAAQPAVQPPAQVRPKLTIPQRRDDRPLHRPNPLQYNQNQNQ
ncbi:MAG: hypothetical protein K4571_01985 [Deltaproteobacteria bacterium]